MPDVLAGVNPTRLLHVYVAHVDLSETAAATIAHEARRSADGNETGGLLLGELHDDGHYDVRHAGDPGPHAIRQPAFFLRDLAHAQHLATATWTLDRSQWIGEWHTHPRGPAHPSGTDLTTYGHLLDDPDLVFTAILSIIVSPGPGGLSSWTAWSVSLNYELY